MIFAAGRSVLAYWKCTILSHGITRARSSMELSPVRLVVTVVLVLGFPLRRKGSVNGEMENQ